MLDFDLVVGLEILQVQDRLGFCCRGVGQLQRVGDPLAVAGNLLPGNAAPLRVVVDRQHLSGGRLRRGQRVGSERNEQGKG